MNLKSEQTLLVAGGSGHLGRRIIEHLLDGGATHVVTTTRTPDKIADLVARGVVVREASYDEPANLKTAFAGVDRVFAISTDSVGRRAKQIENVVAAAEAAGVGHLLYTSAPSPRPNLDGHVTNDHFWSEVAITASKLSWTILRHNMWTEHIYLYLPIAVATGRLVSAMGDGGRSYVTREDCARANAAALAGTSTECRILDVTGPAPVGQGELAQIASELTGVPIEYVHASREEAQLDWVAGGLFADFADGLGEFDVLARQGYHCMVTPVIEELTGKPPESVREYLTRNRDDLFPDENGRARIDVHMARPTAV